MESLPSDLEASPLMPVAQPHCGKRAAPCLRALDTFGALVHWCFQALWVSVHQSIGASVLQCLDARRSVLRHLWCTGVP
ncbi:UNVERIFIED_CONTAM: hypothetical protein FKN15_069804 [Acipenser sinensis]